MANPLKSGRTPTAGLLLGLVVTLAAVVAYTGYITYQIKGLREMQSNIIDRNRKDSLQLLRIQNDLNSLGIAMRDMLDANEPYPLSAWSAQFQRIRQDLSDAMRQGSGALHGLSDGGATALHGRIAGAILGSGRPHVCAGFVRQRRRGAPRDSISLQAHEAALSIAVARQLVANNEAEQQAGERIQEIY